MRRLVMSIIFILLGISGAWFVFIVLFWYRHIILERILRRGKSHRQIKKGR